jgi:hypothetical protein
MDNKERNERIELYGRGFDLLKADLANVPPEAWRFKPEPKEWSVHEIILHLADSETNAALRARMLIVQPGGTLMAYDQDQWAVTLDYHGQNFEDALETVRLVRKSTYELLKKQPDEIFAHSVKHPEFEDPYTFERWLKIYSGHIPGHIEQIRNNVEVWKKK